MQYMLMCCFDETAWNELPAAQKDRIMRDYGDWIQNLAAAGRLRGGAKLYPAPSAKTVRMKNGKAVFTDGPFAETKEQIGGILLLDTRNLDHATELMSKHPGIRVATFEMRPIDEQSTENVNTSEPRIEK